MGQEISNADAETVFTLDLSATENFSLRIMETRTTQSDAPSLEKQCKLAWMHSNEQKRGNDGSHGHVPWGWLSICHVH